MPIQPRRSGPGGGSGGSGGAGPQGGKKKFFYRRKRVCKFCVEKLEYIDYKDVKMLQQFIPERGKILPRRISGTDRKSTRLNSSHRCISYAVFCLKKKNKQ